MADPLTVPLRLKPPNSGKVILPVSEVPLWAKVTSIGTGGSVCGVSTCVPRQVPVKFTWADNGKLTESPIPNPSKQPTHSILFRLGRIRVPSFSFAIAPCALAQDTFSPNPRHFNSATYCDVTPLPRRRGPTPG